MKFPVKIILYEHVCGGGYAGQPIPLDVLAEGFAMLRSVVADFKAAGRDIVVLLDARIAKLNPPLDADCTVPVFDSQQTTRFLADTAKTSDAIYIIAPETDGTLHSLVALAEQTGKLSFNAESSAIARVSDKAAVHKILQKLNAAPKALEFSLKDDAAKVKKTVKAELGFPAVFKPVDGVSCGGLSLVLEESQIQKAIAKIKSQSNSPRFLAQEYVEGEAASVSVLCTGRKALAVSLNKQLIQMGTPTSASSYLGGAVPFDHPRRQEAMALAERVVESFSGLRGYVGVDMVLTRQKPLVVDVNPRLTTSYVGLRSVACFNVAEALLNAALNGKLPKNIDTKGVACFRKIQTATPNPTAYKKTLLLKQAITPPFPLKSNQQATAFVVGHGKTLETAEADLKKAKERLYTIVGGGRRV